MTDTGGAGGGGGGGGCSGRRSVCVHRRAGGRLGHAQHWGVHYFDGNLARAGILRVDKGRLNLEVAALLEDARHALLIDVLRQRVLVRELLALVAKLRVVLLVFAADDDQLVLRCDGHLFWLVAGHFHVQFVAVANEAGQSAWKGATNAWSSGTQATRKTSRFTARSFVDVFRGAEKVFNFLGEPGSMIFKSDGRCHGEDSLVSVVVWRENWRFR